MSLDSGRRYLLWRGAADMRKGMDSLCGLVRDARMGDPMSGDVYVFINGRRTQVKMLAWDRTGFALYWKRLERGTFAVPPLPDGPADCSVAWPGLVLILEGIELKDTKQRKRYVCPQKGASAC